MLVDFGLAVSPGHTSMGGTPGYMAPEAAAGQPVDKRSDVYGTCVVLTELLKGTRLFPQTGALAATHQQAAAGLGGLGTTAATITAGVTLTGTAATAGGVATTSSGTGAATATLTRGKLFAAGGIGAAVIAAVAAFLVFRPDPPQQTATSAPTTTTPPPGASPAAAGTDGPLLRGTYRLTSQSRFAGANTGPASASSPRLLPIARSAT
jgi:serine/threonine protein kinase